MIKKGIKVKILVGKYKKSDGVSEVVHKLRTSEPVHVPFM